MADGWSKDGGMVRDAKMDAHEAEAGELDKRHSRKTREAT